MNAQGIGIVVAIVLAILNAFFLGIKWKKDSKHKTSSNNPKYGERIAALEKGQENIEERLDRIEDKINRR